MDLLLKALRREEVVLFRRRQQHVLFYQLSKDPDLVPGLRLEAIMRRGRADDVHSLGDHPVEHGAELPLVRDQSFDALSILRAKQGNECACLPREHLAERHVESIEVGRKRRYALDAGLEGRGA
jgi:hypothetical protein